jgi:hypothetical protein
MRLPARIINRGRYRDEIVNASSLAASCDISGVMSRNWLPLMGSQCWGCDARGCNCSAKNQLRHICHDFLLRVQRAEDWITSPQIPSHSLEHDAEPRCRRATHRSEHRQAAGATAHQDFASRLHRPRRTARLYSAKPANSAVEGTCRSGSAQRIDLAVRPFG